MLKNKGTYEIISPEDIGLMRVDESALVLGKLRHGAQEFDVPNFDVIWSNLNAYTRTDVPLSCFSISLYS